MTPLDLARRIVRAASRLVPAWRRREWEREWDAELHHHAGDASGSAGGTIIRSTGAVADAAVLRAQAMQFDLFWHDVRFAWRNAARRPGFTALVVTTLALGIGVNSAVFALLDGALFRPLPYRDPGRLVFVWQTLPGHGVLELEPTPYDYAAWRGLRSFDALAMVASEAFTIAGGDDPERVRGARVTASLMPLLGIAPQIGRGFSPDEDADGAAPVVILSDGLWRRRCGADARAIGRIVRVNGVNHTIVGVMPPGARLPGHLAESSDLWLPARMTPAERDNPISHNYVVLARLAGGASLQSASTELEAFAQRMAADRPDSHANIGARLVPLEEQTVRGIRPTLVVVAGGVGLLLVVACANAVTLLIARAGNRRHETAVRTALGATDSRLRSLAITESLTYAVLGGLAGLALGGWTLRGLLPLFAEGLPPGAPIAIDARVAVFTAVLSIALGLVFGVAVAAHHPGRLVDALKSSARTTTAGGSIARSRSLLVVAQVALAVVLLSAAGLMLNSVAKLSRVSPGFDAGHLLSFRLSLVGGGYTAAPQRVRFADDLTRRLSSAPGVAQAALTSTIPFGGSRGADGVEIEGRAVVRGETIIIDQRLVTPGYFQTMRIPVRLGRGLRPADDGQAERVVVINRTMARQYWPDESPIDRRVRLSAGFGAGEWLRIVGVVDDVRHIALSREFVPEMYRPYSQAAAATFTVVVRTIGDSATAAPIARDVVRALDSSLPLYDVRPMTDRIASSFAQARATMLLLLVTALLAAALAAVAIYGSIWYAVSQRIPEIGIRLALGATRASVCADVIGRALALTAAGAACGTAAAVAAGPLLKGLLFDTPATDPATFGAVIISVFALTAAASIPPARRAMSVDPMVALRSE